MPDARFLAFYPGYTLEDIAWKMDDLQYTALLERIPHIERMSAIGALYRSMTQ